MSDCAASVPPPSKRPKSKKSLAQRLNQACAAVPALEKLGRNPEYNYVFAAQVFEAFRAELFKRQILLLPDELEYKSHLVPTLPGVVLNRVQIKTAYEFRDCYGLEPSIVLHSYGTGIDGGDKALYKAKTGSMKSFFKILGIIPYVESDDPESDATTDDLTNPKVYEASKGKTLKDKRLADRQVRAFDSMCHQTGKTAQQVSEYLRARWSCASVSELPAEEFNECMKWAAQSADLMQQIQESLVAATSKKNGKAEVPAEEMGVKLQ